MEFLELNLKDLFNVLVQIPDVQDIVIRDRIFCVKTDSNDYVHIDFSQYEDRFKPNENIPADKMTLSDFGVKYKTVKILSDNFENPVQYFETDDSVLFLFNANQAFRSRIPMLNNNFSLEEWNELFGNAERIGEITIKLSDFQKIKAMLELYKANPWLELTDDNELSISVISSNKNDSSSFPVSENILGEVINKDDPIKLQRILFTYGFGSDVKLEFYKSGDNLIVKATGTIDGVDTSYAFIVGLSNSLDDLGVDISGIDLDLSSETF